MSNLVRNKLQVRSGCVLVLLGSFLSNHDQIKPAIGAIWVRPNPVRQFCVKPCLKQAMGAIWVGPHPVRQFCVLRFVNESNL